MRDIRTVNLFRVIVCALAAGVVVFATDAFADCKILNLGELPVKVEDGRLLIDGTIDGHPIRMVVDTGAPDNMIYRDAARRLGLQLTELRHVEMYGVGGQMHIQTTRIQTLTLGSLVSRNEVMFAGGDHQDSDPRVVGLIGRRFLAQADLEFDIAHGALRFLKPVGCTDPQMAYWATSAYSQADLDAPTDSESSISGRVKLNGVPILATFETGSSFSFVTQAAAESAGVRPGGEGVTPVEQVVGLGPRPIPAWIATFKSFSIGDETIGNAKLRMSDLFVYSKVKSLGSNVPYEVGSESKMLIGLDFFKAHRVLISQSRHKMYFTYSGGRIFDTRAEGDAGDAPVATPPAR